MANEGGLDDFAAGWWGFLNGFEAEVWRFVGVWIFVGDVADSRGFVGGELVLWDFVGDVADLWGFAGDVVDLWGLVDDFWGFVGGVVDL